MHSLSAAEDSRVTNFRALTKLGSTLNGRFSGQPILFISDDSDPDGDPGTGRRRHATSIYITNPSWI